MGRASAPSERWCTRGGSSQQGQRPLKRATGRLAGSPQARLGRYTPTVAPLCRPAGHRHRRPSGPRRCAATATVSIAPSSSLRCPQTGQRGTGTSVDVPGRQKGARSAGLAERRQFVGRVAGNILHLPRRPVEWALAVTAAAARIHSRLLNEQSTHLREGPLPSESNPLTGHNRNKHSDLAPRCTSRLCVPAACSPVERCCTAGVTFTRVPAKEEKVSEKRGVAIPSCLRMARRG